MGSFYLDKMKRHRMVSEKAESIRKRYKYRRLIMSGKMVLPHDDAVRLLGPDCAYHLYSVDGSEDGQKSRRNRKSRKRSTRRPRENTNK